MTTYIPAALASMAATAQTAPDEGLSFSRILADLPTDPASIFTLLLVGVSVALVLWYGRPKSGKGGRTGKAE